MESECPEAISTGGICGPSVRLEDFNIRRLTPLVKRGEAFLIMGATAYSSGEVSLKPTIRGSE